jgi:hypothetical protein
MAIPTEHAKRDYLAFLRGPVGTNSFAFGSVAEYRGGVQHHGLVAKFPEPGDNPMSDFGIQAGGGFTVEISDEIEGDGLLDWFLLQEDETYLLLEDNTRFAMEY